MTKRDKHVTKPVISLQLSGTDGTGRHKIQVWVGDAGETITVADRRDFIFGGSKTASLVYEEQGTGHYASEYNIWNESTWKWIQKWMERGLIAEGHMKPEDSANWKPGQAPTDV